MAPAAQSPQTASVSRFLGAIAAIWTFVAATLLLSPRPLADAFFAGWVVIAVALALTGAVAAWTRRTPIVWVAAILLSGLAVVGVMSVGLYIAPAALALLVSAGLLQLTGPREWPREAILAEPPTVLEAVLKTLAGAIVVVLGVGLVYEGAVGRELFLRGCANETLVCALAVTNWDAVGLTIVGLAALGGGAYLVWRQVYVGRVLASNQPG